jgi:hypothetical protein
MLKLQRNNLKIIKLIRNFIERNLKIKLNYPLQKYRHLK